MTSLDKILNIEDLRRVAERRLPQPVFAFVEGGAEDERTVARNRAAFGEWALLPRAVQDVSEIDASVTLFEQRCQWPFVVGPTGMPGMVHIAGEAAIALAAAKAGILYSLSTMASQSIEDVAAASPGPKLFQLYLFKDRGLSRELLERARDAGYVGLILTVDVQVPANRERDRRYGMTLPPRFGARSVIDFALRPRWVYDQLVRKPLTLANFDRTRASPGSTLLEFINAQFDPAISWDDVEWVAKQWPGPMAIKGVMRPDDACIAADRGVTTVILSNHGGRQLDGGAAPLDTLPETVERLHGRADVILDGGIRRGTDMLKAIALGASGCMSGRIGLYGLATGGASGAEHALRILRSEFERDLALLGTSRVAEIGRNCVMPLMTRASL